MMNSAFDGKDIETARGSTKSLSSSEKTDQSKENKKENLNDGIKKTSNTSDRKSKSLSKGSSRKDADGTLTDEVFEGKTPESSQGSKRSLSSTNPNENQGEKLNRSVTEKNLKHEKRKSKSSTKGLKQTDNLDGSLMKEEYIEKDLEFYPGPTKSCRNAVDDDEDKENREELINVGVKEKRSKQDEREKRKSKSSSKDLKQKDILDGKSLNYTSSGKGIQSRTMDIQEKKSKDGETMGSKSKQDVDLNSEHEVNHFKENQNEKRKSRTKSIGSKKDDYRPKPFKEEPEDSDFLTIHNERKRTQLTVQDGEAKEVAGTAMKEVLKQKKLETPSRSKKGLEEEKKVNQDHDKINGNQEKSNKKEKRKSKIKSMDLKQIDFDGGESIKGELDDSVFLPAPMEGKREKRPRSEDTDGTPGSKTFKKEPEDQDFVIIPKDVKRKRSMAEGAEEALSERKIKKIKTEINDQELSTKEEKSEQEIQLKKKKKKKKEEKEVEIKPKKEKEGNQETKKKKTKEERELIADIKAKKKEEEEKQQWRWWEEQKYEDGINWMFLEHKGPVFAPLYEPLPENVNFYYDGKPLKLCKAAEEVTSFFAKMLDHEYTTNDVFRKNFFMDWRKEMTLEEKIIIADLGKCDFTEMFTYYKGKMEEKRNPTKEQKLANKEANEKVIQEYGFCIMDHHRERIGNFKIEPPGLFRGRGDHPKQGMLKKRILPEDVIINCSKDSKIPEPPEGHKWKEVRHDNTVTWLASWTENVQGSNKYVMLNANSRLKGEKDWEKYEVARKLKTCVDRIRAQYHEDLKSKEMKLRQRAVALYFIDKLALRAGNEKEEGETADTVGCCSLRVEHIKLYPELDGEKHVVEFDFLGKDCIRYYNKVPVEKQVFKNLQLFMEEKQGGDDLFDRLNTPMLNKHLQSLMEGLTAKVFRTYNASITLQDQLKKLTDPDEPVPSKILSYNRANRAVAILCNHQRAAPKTFEQSMANLQTKIDAKKEKISLAKSELKQAKLDAKSSDSEKLKKVLESKKKAVKRAEEQLMKLEVQATDREENKQIALGTSKLNYLDPRISVTWCQKWGVGLEKIYNKTLRDKFAWAINMSDASFVF